MKHFEHTLPEGYRAARTIDATEKRLGIILNAVSICLTVVIIAVAAVLIRPSGEIPIFGFFILSAALFAYIVLHELVHGAAYKLLTREKLTFGMTWSVAYCGVPHIFVYRRAAMIALLSPFVVFSLLFGGAALLLPGAWARLGAACLFAVHTGGCSGDLYCTALYLFRYRQPSVLMQDTGPKQTFFVKD